MWFRRPGTLSGPRRSVTSRSLPDLPACPAELAARCWANEGHPRDTLSRPARPPDRSWPVTWREERPRSLGRRDAGRNRLPGRQRAPSSRGDTLAGRAGGCPGRTPAEAYPASPTGQHCPLRPRPRPREHRPRFTRPARPPAHSWPGTGREGRPRLAGPADPRHPYIDLTLWGWCRWKVWFRRPGNSFGASPLRHQPKFARPACLPGRVGRETLGQRGAPAGHAYPACPPAQTFLACHQAGGTAAEPRPGETVCQAASGHPRAGETLSPGARADAPGEHRLRFTRPPRPGNTLAASAETLSPGEGGQRFTRPPLPANIARLGRHTLGGRAGRCPGRTPVEVYPAQRARLRSRPRRPGRRAPSS